MKISNDAWHKIVNDIYTNSYTNAHLDLSGLELNSVNIKELVKALEQNTYITSLDLRNNKLGDLGMKVLASNTTLTSLDVSANLITPNLVNIAKEKAANELLISLGLEPTYSPIFPGLEALAANTTLVNLNISDNNIGDEGAKSLAANKTLSSLNVSNNNIAFEGIQALAFNKTFSNLAVHFNNIGSKEIEVLANNTTLSSLELYYFKLNPQDVKALANNKTLTSLKFLWMPSEAFTILSAPDSTLSDLDIGRRSISYDEWHKLLVEIETNQYTHSDLNLSFLGLNSIDIKELTKALENNSHITSLNLEGCTYRDSYKLIHDWSIVELVSKTKLTSLNISNNQLGVETAKALAENQTLTSLNISNNFIGNEGAAFLANNAKLISLILSGNEINKETVNYLARPESKLVDLDAGLRKMSLDSWHKLLTDIETNEYVETHLSLNAQGLHDLNIRQLLQALEKNTSINSLDVSSNMISDSSIHLLATNTAITNLDVSNNGKIGIDGIKALASNATLRILNVSSNAIGAEGAKILAQNDTLTHLTILNNDVGVQGAKDLAKNHTLIGLTISGSEIGKEGLEALTHLDSTIIDLDTGSRTISIEKWHAMLVAIESNQYTENQLDLSYSNLNNLDVRQLAHALESNHYIKSINLEGNTISVLAELAANLNLTHLNVSHNQLEASQALVLSKNTALVHLDIGHNNIGDSGAIALAASNGLTHLDVNSNQIGTKGVEILAKNSKIIDLNIGNNDITEMGVIALAENVTLTNLGISNTHLTEMGINALIKNNTLTHLNLRHNEMPASELLSLIEHKNFISLDIGGNFADATVLAALGQSATLTSLTLCNNLAMGGQLYYLYSRGDDGDKDYYYTYRGNYDILLPLTEIATLKHLDLSFNYGFLLDTKVVQPFMEMPSLLTFNVEHSGCDGIDYNKYTLDDRGVEYRDAKIFDLIKNPDLSLYFDTKAYESHLKMIEGGKEHLVGIDLHNSDAIEKSAISVETNFIVSESAVSLEEAYTIENSEESISILDVLSGMDEYSNILVSSSIHEIQGPDLIPTVEEIIMPISVENYFIEPVQDYVLG